LNKSIGVDALLRARSQLEKAYEAIPGRIKELNVEIAKRTGPVIPVRTGLVLSPREEEVLVYLYNRLSNKEIGAKLGITERTVKYHVSNLLAKMGKRHRWELIYD
jgi:DNA-binding NarL/FixJ family response regulator